MLVTKLKICGGLVESRALVSKHAFRFCLYIRLFRDYFTVPCHFAYSSPLVNTRNFTISDTRSHSTKTFTLRRRDAATFPSFIYPTLTRSKYFHLCRFFYTKYYFPLLSRENCIAFFHVKATSTTVKSIKPCP